MPAFVSGKGVRGVMAGGRGAGAAGRGEGKDVGVGLLGGSEPQGMCGWGWWRARGEGRSGRGRAGEGRAGLE